MIDLTTCVAIGDLLNTRRDDTERGLFVTLNSLKVTNRSIRATTTS